MIFAKTARVRRLINSWICCGCVIVFPACGLSSKVYDGKASTLEPKPTVTDGGVIQSGVMVVSQSTVDFGQVACGSGVDTRTLVIGNIGQTEVIVTATLTGDSAFSLDSDSTIRLSAGSQGSIVVKQAAVPASSVPGSVVEANLGLQSNAAGASLVNIPIRRVASGGKLVLNKNNIAFNAVPRTTSDTPVSVTLRNEGNQAVNVTLPADTGPFTATYRGAPATQTIAPSGSLGDLAFGFTPTMVGTFNGSFPITVDGPVCGDSATAVTVSGTGTNSKALVSATELDFGNTNCGGKAAPREIAVTNTGTTAFTFTAALNTSGNNNFTVSPTSATVNAGATVTISVTPKSIPSTVGTLPGDFGGSLTITTTAAGDEPHIVRLRQGAQGAIIQFNQSTLTFGQVPENTSTVDASLSVSNVGNLSANILLGVGGTNAASYSVMPNTSTRLDPNARVSVAATFSPDSSGVKTATISAFLAQSGLVLCAPLPPSVSVTGTGRQGGIALGASALNFGLTNCGSTASPQTVTLRNTGNSTVNLTMSLARGTSSAYRLSTTAQPTLTTSLSQNVSGGETLTLWVTPSAIPSNSPVTENLYGGRIHVVTSIPDDVDPSIDLTQTARGAILSVAPGSLSFGNVAVGQKPSQSIEVRNSGNVGIGLNWLSSRSEFTTTGSTVNISPSGTANLNVSFAPVNYASVSATLQSSVASSGVAVCGGSLPSVALTGTGVNAVAYTPGTVDFGNTPCGTSATAAQVVFTNPSNTPYNITSASLISGSAWYTLATSGTTVPANGAGSVTMTLTPRTIPQTSAVPGSYGGILRVTTDVPGDTPHNIPILQNAYGAILTVPSHTIAFNNTIVLATGYFDIYVANSGNAPAPLQFTAPHAFGNVFSFVPGVIATPGEVQQRVRFTPTNAQLYSGAASRMTVPSGTPLCAPLPNGNFSQSAVFTLSGTGIEGANVFVDQTTLAFTSNGAPAGFVYCGGVGTTPTQTVRLTALASTLLPWTASVNNGYTLSQTSGTVSSGSPASITVAPATIPIASTTNPGSGYNGVLTITIPGGSPSTFSVQLQQTAYGAALNYNGSTLLAFPDSDGQQTLRVNNVGNYPAPVTVTTGGIYADAALTSLNSGNNTLLMLVPEAEIGSGSFANFSIFRTGSDPRYSFVRATTTAPLCRPVVSNVLLSLP